MPILSTSVCKSLLMRSIPVRSLTNNTDVLRCSGWDLYATCLDLRIDICRRSARRLLKGRHTLVPRRIFYAQSQITKSWGFKKHPAMYSFIGTNVPVFNYEVETVVPAINNSSMFQVRQSEKQTAIAKIHFGGYLPSSAALHFDPIRVDHARNRLKIYKLNPHQRTRGASDQLATMPSLDQPKWRFLNSFTHEYCFGDYAKANCFPLRHASQFRPSQLAGDPNKQEKNDAGNTTECSPNPL